MDKIKTVNHIFYDSLQEALVNKRDGVSLEKAPDWEKRLQNSLESVQGGVKFVATNLNAVKDLVIKNLAETISRKAQRVLFSTSSNYFLAVLFDFINFFRNLFLNRVISKVINYDNLTKAINSLLLKINNPLLDPKLLEELKEKSLLLANAGPKGALVGKKRLQEEIGKLESQLKEILEIHEPKEKLLQGKKENIEIENAQKKKLTHFQSRKAAQLTEKQLQMEKLETDLTNLENSMSGLAKSITSSKTSPVVKQPHSSKESISQRVKTLVDKAKQNALPSFTKLENALLEKRRQKSQIQRNKDSLQQEIDQLGHLQQEAITQAEKIEQTLKTLNREKEHLSSGITQDHHKIEKLQKALSEKKPRFRELSQPKNLLATVLQQQKEIDTLFFSSFLQERNPEFSLAAPITSQASENITPKGSNAYEKTTVVFTYPILLRGSKIGSIVKTLSYGIDSTQKENPFLFHAREEKENSLSIKVEA